MKPLFAPTLFAVIVAASASSAGAAETGQMPMQGMQGMHGKMGQHQGMMSCPMMSGGMGRGMGMTGHAVPSLPPGNEKLQLQMHAEIMQKVGEIMAKYAGQIQSR
jgi:hypothetical protein